MEVLHADPNKNDGPRIDVSIVVPCHNYARYLRTCLDSALRQVHCDIEVIVVDDASTDDSPAILREYAGDRVRVVREQLNRGYVHAYRRGMSLATGRMLLPLDADDFIVADDALLVQLALADSDDRIGFVHSGWYEVDAAGRRLRVRSAWGRTGIYRSKDAFARLLLANSVQHSGTLIRAAVYRDLGGYDARLRNSIDWDLWLRIARQYDVGFVDRPLFAYRRHGKNMHQRVMLAAEERAPVLAEVFEVIDRATADRPDRERRRAYASARVLMANAHLSAFRLREAVDQLRKALGEDPTVAFRSGAWSVIARLLIVVVLGRRGYDALRARPWQRG